MATTELLLLQPVEHLGHEGETVSVRAGYARNFLLPRGIAIPVTRSNRKQIESLARARENRLAKELEGASAIAKRLGEARIAIAVKTGPGGRLFGAVTAADLLTRLGEEGIPLDKKSMHLAAPVKTLGKHEVKIKLHAEVTVDFEFEVVSENPIEETPVVEEPAPVKSRAKA